MHESDPAKQGSPLAALRAACPDEHRELVFGGVHDVGGVSVIAWHRVKHFQLVSLAQIAEQLLLASPAYGYRALDAQGLPLRVEHGLAWAPSCFQQPVALHTSPSDSRGTAVAVAIAEHFPNVQLAPASDGARWLLGLEADSFAGESGAQLADEVEAALLGGAVPVMVYAPEEVAFGAIIDATPRRLKELGLYGPLAIEWRDGAHRTASLQLVALALGATTGGGCDVGTWDAARVKRLWAAKRPRRRVSQLVSRWSSPRDGEINSGSGSAGLEMKLNVASTKV